jgi:uncharacterized protein YdhG (YjbR/CyaY superfamily)
MQSKAKTVTEYVNELPAERKADIKKMRALIKKHLPKGYVEGMGWGMITYSVPLSVYPAGYGENPEVPIPYVALASQKNYMAVYLDVYTNPKTEKWFKDEYKKSGKKMDMGKSCVRFKRIEDLPLDLIAKTVALTPVKKYAANYAAVRQELKKKARK